MLEAHFAVPMIGAVLVNMNYQLSSQEILYILNHSDTKCLFVDSEFIHLIEPIYEQCPNLSEIITICDIDRTNPLNTVEYETLLQKGSKDFEDFGVEDERQVMAINYTSGTTGTPKGIMYHHRGAYLVALDNALELSIQAGSSYLWTLPMFHCNGWCFPWAVTAVGATHVCLRKIHPETIFTLIEQEHVTHMCGAPVILKALATYSSTKKIKVQRPLKIATGGAPPSPHTISQMESLGAEVVHLYGLTEVYGPFTICAWQSKWNALSFNQQAKLRSRQGVPYIVAHHVDVLDPATMDPVPRDGQTIGEIVMRGNTVMLGYYKDLQATEEVFRGGWFHTGDLAVITPDNYIEIKDREKDIIISGGENISSVEIENVIHQHPAVLYVAVIPVCHPKRGESPKAFVQLKDEASLTEKELIHFCQERLTPFKVPRKIEFCQLPKTSTGKIQKFVLRQKERLRR
jgi:fatty-acyl-CoA synthase